MNRLSLLVMLLLGVTIHAQIDTVSIFFEIDKSIPSVSEREKLTAYSLEEYKVVGWEAHCDTSGSLAYNMKLAQRRGDWVEAFYQIGELKLTKVFGESVAGKSKRYASERFRRVDILLERREADIAVSLEEVQEVQEEPQSKDDADILVDKFVDFLKDSSETETLIKTNILFYPGSEQYRNESADELYALFDFLKYNPGIRAHIRGHICCDIYREWDELSSGRAQNIYSFLVRGGIHPERLSFKGYGTSLPVRTPEVTEYDKSLNRRVDIIFKKQDEE